MGAKGVGLIEFVKYMAIVHSKSGYWRTGIIFAALLLFVSALCFLFMNRQGQGSAEARQVPSSGERGDRHLPRETRSSSNDSRANSATELDKLRGEKALLGRIKELLDQPNSLERQRDLAKICAKLSQEIGVKAATAKVSELAGPGKNREWLLMGVIAGANEDLGVVMSVIRGMEYEDDRNGCLSGLANYIASNKCDVGDVLKFSPFDKKEAESVLYGMVYMASGLEEGGGLHQALLGKVEEVKLVLERSDLSEADRKEFLGLYLRNVSGAHPTEALSVAVSALGKYDGSTREAYDWILSNAFKSDSKSAVKVLEDLLASGKLKDSPAIVTSAVQRWMKYDQQAALDWIRQSEGLGEGVKSYAAMPFFQQAINAGDLATAKSWSDQISSPELRKDVEGKVWSLDRDQLRKKVSQNPQETVQGIVSGSNGIEPYWLEEAVYTWASKDFDQAVKWNEANWNSLPASKAQYVAAAFATLSLNQKDVAAAKHWAALIEDAKTKERINTAIAKASGAK